MSYGDFIYIASEQGGEEQLLGRVEPLLAALAGDHTVRIKRGSGWVLMERQKVDVGSDFSAVVAHEASYDLTEDQKASKLSRELGVDVLRVGWVSSVSGVTFTRCRAGERVRRFWYTPEEQRNHGFYPDEGKLEAWEQPFRKKGLELTDIGEALRLPGLDKKYFGEKWEEQFELVREIKGKVLPKRPRPPPENISKAWELVAPAIVGVSLLAALGFVVQRRMRGGGRRDEAQ